jgi:hypothetical protein
MDGVMADTAPVLQVMDVEASVDMLAAGSVARAWQAAALAAAT